MDNVQLSERLAVLESQLKSLEAEVTKLINKLDLFQELSVKLAVLESRNLRVESSLERGVNWLFKVATIVVSAYVIMHLGLK